MRLLFSLTMRLMGVVLICLTLAIGWIVLEAQRSIERGTADTAIRVDRQLQALYWQKIIWRNGLSKESLLPLPNWRSLETLKAIAPGVCVTYAPPGTQPTTLCSQVEALGAPAPAWFSRAYMSLAGSPGGLKRPLSVRSGGDAGVVITKADPDGALRQVWAQVSTVVGVAAMMAAAIAALSALMLGHALLPAKHIISALKNLQFGHLQTRLPEFRRVEFNLIANAFNNLASDLAKTNAERNALTTRLLEVQEEERRNLARDLHDEFGQTLSATRALATLIESKAGAEREDIAADAREISKAQGHMMTALRNTLIRLRAQNVEELGLEASLRQLVSDYNTQSGSQAVFRLQVSGELSSVRKNVAADLYRISQECLTNAVRHGKPTEVQVRVAKHGPKGSHIALSVEDNGGGNIERIGNRQGFGIVGMRERLASLGGDLEIRNADCGIHVCATIPLDALPKADLVSGAQA